jgi:hypothetical protein
MVRNAFLGLIFADPGGGAEEKKRRFRIDDSRVRGSCRIVDMIGLRDHAIKSRLDGYIHKKYKPCNSPSDL